MTTTTAHRTAIAALAVATALTLGMTASTWNPYTRAIDSMTTSTPDPAPTHESTPVLLGGYWSPVNSDLADAMAEGGAPDATTRDWESCRAHLDKDWSIVVCPDGYQEEWDN